MYKDFWLKKNISDIRNSRIVNKILEILFISLLMYILHL